MKASLLAVPVLWAVSTIADDSSIAYVDLSTTRGESAHNTSAFIYGMPLNYDPNQIPDHFYSDISIKWGRAGGGQLADPCRGWAFGEDEYACRFNATMLNYKQTRKFDAQFIILPHDIWGIDYRDTISDYVWPGTDGNWTSYDNFLDRLISDLKANDALDGLVWDIWNEPDGSGFWGGGLQQWVDLYIRTHKRLRSDSDLDDVLISGPTLAGSPSLFDTWWTTWATQVSGNETYPDQYVWHCEGGGSSSDPAVNNPILEELLSKYGLPFRPVNINEYATLTEMKPSGYAWWISRLERYNYAGLLGLWEAPLYDNFANLLTKYPGDPQDTSNTNYTTAAGYAVYQYYATSMVGERAVTTASTDLLWDCFATIGDEGDLVRILAGSRVATGNYSLQIQGLESVGYSATGTLDFDLYAFNGTADIFDPIGDPLNLGTQSVSITDGSATLNFDDSDKYTGWRIEFPRQQGDYDDIGFCGLRLKRHKVARYSEKECISEVGRYCLDLSI